MSCCGIRSPKGAMKLCVRVSFGLSLLLVGISHYMSISIFEGMVSDGLGALTVLGSIWAYILPGLMILAGALFTVGMYTEIASWAGGLALGSIPVGMLLKSVMSGLPLSDMMPFALNAMIWLLLYIWAVKFSCCCCSGNCAPDMDRK